MNWEIAMMNWEIANTLATWACALAATVCGISVMRLIAINRRAHIATMASLTEMADTYRRGWLILNGDLEQLRQRVLDLETDAP
jgi:hypothetical protein